MKNRDFDEIELRALDTATLSDAMESAGLPAGRIPGCRPLAGVGRMAGPALPVLLGTWAGDRPGAHLSARALAEAGPGEVLVIDNAGRTEAACFGGLMAAAAGRAAIGGVVVHGAVRDVEAIRESGLPVYATATHPASARGRFVELATGQPVMMESTIVRAGDWIVADATGVIAIPADRLQEVLTIARGLHRYESELEAKLLRGDTVGEVLDARYETVLAGADRADPAPPPPDSFSTCALSDALDVLGLPGQCRDIKPRLLCGSVSGPAFTVSYEAVGPGGEGTVGDYIGEVPPGSVVVIDNGGRTDCTVWGGLLSRAAVARGVAGTFIDGACRDLDEARRVGNPLFSRGVTMRSGKGRVRLKSLNDTVTLGGVQVDPGDQIIADEHGVIVVPARHLTAVLEAAGHITRTERKVLCSLGAGDSLAVARARAGYHEIRKQP
jgi:regulator of RNase E activity RraA